MSNQKDFLKDIGLGPQEIEHLLLKEAKVTNNIRSFYTPHSSLMDNPRTAVLKHIRNLINTYGEDIVLEAVETGVFHE